MGHRRMARELALHALYSVEMTGDPVDTVLKDVSRWRKYSREALLYATRLTTNVSEHLTECDRLIEETVRHWELSRIALLDRIILRMGICELLLEGDVPSRVAIDEAIELAKKYSTEKSGGFVNGILDTIHKKHMSHVSQEKNKISSETTFT
ncbi:MAG: transcription antitermination factor NusB [Gemmatimonadota bacterium]|nr:MAG: transcription antitermination factor NusB [Gemmatimonadota bacterium]